jgi:hypothetical protein
MDTLLNLDSNTVLAITKTTNANILAFTFSDGSVDCKWVLRGADMSITKISELPYLEKMLVNFTLEQQQVDGRIRVKFGIPIALDERDLFFCKLPDTYRQSHAIVFDDPKQGPSFLKEVFVDIENSKSYCRCVVLASGAEYIETIGVNLGLLKNFL